MPESPNPKLRPAPEPPPAEVFAQAGEGYAELDVTTNFSFLQGASHADELVLQAARLGYRAIAVTDVNTVAGVVRMHDAAKQVAATGWVPKLIIGARLVFVDAPELLVWMTDRAAYGRLCRLLTLGRRRAEKGECELYLADFLEHQEGMLAAVLPIPSWERGEHVPGRDASLGASQLPPPRPVYSRGEGGGEGLRTVDDLSTDCAGCAEAPHPNPLPGVPGRGDRSAFGLVASNPDDRPLTLTLSPEGERGLERTLRELKGVMGDRLSLAVSFGYGDDDATRVARLAELGRRARVPLVATNHVHYHVSQRRPLQDVLTCVRHGCTIHDAGYRLFPNAERHLKSPAQMRWLFADYPEAVARGLAIAERCTFSLDELRYEYPDEVVPNGRTPLEYLTELAWDGARARYPDRVPDKVRGLIEHELRLIGQLRIEAYFLTVYDLVRYARSRGILCQGRGSAANSAVCYCIGVTSVNPAEIDVLFERFVSAARNEPPDIDIDFEHERREEVIQYVYEKYGRERAGMTATVITYRGRSAVRDVGKALGLGLDMVEQLAGKLDWWHRGTLGDDQLSESGVDPNDLAVRQIIALTAQLLGFPRHLSQHTGGMVMTRGPLCEMVPIENASMDDRTVIEWDKDDIDTLGILKIDVLALGMLTCIAKAFRLIDASGSEAEPRQRMRELYTVPREDPGVYDMICDADTIGVFQIESRAQMSMLPRLKPKKFYDLVIEVAIVRPGPIQGNMVHPYLRRRDKIEPVSYPSPELEGVLSKTLGVPLFQEQAMRVAMVGAGFTGDDADRLRRAMAAWRKNGEIERFHAKIVEGMKRNGYTPEFAEQCFQQIRGFAEYGFPESHSASFALLVYVSAWIKRYHPAAFACALLNSQPMGFYAPAQIVRDAKEHGVPVREVDVNFSEWDSMLESDEATKRRSGEGGGKETWGVRGPALRLGFRQVKGMRQEFGERVVTARRRFGVFTSVEQFQRATGLPVHAIRRLAEADAFGSMGLSRRHGVWETLPLKEDEMPLFDDLALLAEQRTPVPTSLPPMPVGQEVMTDYATTGLSLKRHPVSLVRDQLNPRRIRTSAEVNALHNGTRVKVAGLVLIRQRPGTASGIVFETLEDETGVVNLIIRPDVYERYRPAARHGGFVQADGYVERQDKVVHVMVQRMFDLSHMLAGFSMQSRDFH